MQSLYKLEYIVHARSTRLSNTPLTLYPGAGQLDDGALTEWLHASDVARQQGADEGEGAS